MSQVLINNMEIRKRTAKPFEVHQGRIEFSSKWVSLWLLLRCDVQYAALFQNSQRHLPA